MRYKNLCLFALVAGVLATLFASCSDDDNKVLSEQYGYAQFKIYKNASYPASHDGETRSSNLNLLSDAHKVKVVMQHGGSTISQTLVLNAYSKENAEFGLRSEKIRLLTGEYTIIGYHLYDKMDVELQAGTVDDNVFSVVGGGLTVKDIPVDATARGMVSFRLVKDFAATRAAAEDAYPFGNIQMVDVSVKNTFTQEVTTFKSIPVEYTEDFKEGSADEELYPGKNAETAYGVCDTLLWLKAGNYRVSSYTTYSDKKGKTILEAASVASDAVFTVADNAITENVEVPVSVSVTAEYIKDYIALREIWLALDGPNWSYAGTVEAVGSNWNFNKELDMWGDQPGVELYADGRVATISLDGMGAKGVVPDAIGQLTELSILSFGSHSELLGGHLMENVSADMTAEQKRAMRYDYEEQFLVRDFRSGLSEIWQETINLDENETPIRKNGISLKGIAWGDLTNGITGVSKAIMRLTKLTQFYIANSPITSDGFFVELSPESPYYDEQNEWSWSAFTELLDMEIYNCPNLTSLPVGMIAGLPELQSLNVACNRAVSGSQMKTDWETIIDGACGDKLQILYMGYNNLVEFPVYEKLSRMTKLSLLDCTNNKIERLHPFGKEINLAKVYLDYNKITEIPHTEDGYFCGYTQMESFSASNNRLVEFPDIFNAKSVYVASSIDFSYNSISRFENGNDFRGINASQIDLSGNRLETFPGILFHKNSPITYLILAGNGMREIPDGSMKGDYAYLLEALDLSYNRLTELSDDFYAVRLPYLQGLDLSRNSFSEFPIAPLSITSLQRFFIRYQRDDAGNRCLREWPVGLYKCPSLVFFCIGSNDIRKVEDTISPYIYYFEIADNPNISIDVSSVCDYIQAGYYMLIYDKTQDIRGCSALDLEN